MLIIIFNVKGELNVFINFKNKKINEIVEKVFRVIGLKFNNGLYYLGVF